MAARYAQVVAATTAAVASGQRRGEGALALCPCGKELLYHPERLTIDRLNKIRRLWDQARIIRATRRRSRRR